METSEPLEARAETGRLTEELQRVIDGTPETALILKFGMAVVSVFAALIITLWVRREIGQAFTPIIASFLCAIMLSAWFGGVGPGLLAIALSLLVIEYAFASPFYSLALNLKEIPRLVVFTFSALFVGLLSAAQKNKAESLRRASHVLDETLEELGRTNEALRTENAERTQAEGELRRQKEILQKIFDHIPLMISFVEADGRIKLVNREWERALGWSLKEIREQNLDVFAEFYPDPQYRQEVLKFIAEANGKWSDFKTRVRDGRVMDTTFVRVLLSDRTSIGIGQDITERKRTEEALRSGQERYRKLSGNFPNGAVITYDTDLRVTFIAGRGLDEAGFSPDFFIGKLLGEIAPPEVVAIAEPHFRAAFGGQTEIYECTYPDGRVYFCAVAPLLNGNGLITEIQVITQDITRPKQAEEALRASEEQFRQLAENIREVFWLATADLSKMLYISPAYEAVWGQSCESLYREPRAFFAAIHAEDRSRVGSIIEQAREQGFEVEYRVVRPDGSIRCIRDRGFPIKDASGHFYRVAGIAEDVTERKHAEKELTKDKEVLEKIFDNIPVMIGFVGEDGRVKLVNSEWERSMGWTLKELQDQNVDIFAEAYPDATYRREILEFVSAATGEWVDLKIRVRDGRVIDVACAVVHLSDGTKVAIAQDITGRKQGEKQLREKESQLAEAQHMANVGSWNWDLQTNAHTWSDELYQIYGLNPGDSSASHETFIELVHPDDRVAVREAIELAIKTQEPINAFLRIIRPNGSERIIHSRGNTVLDGNGTPIRMHGTVQDVTERKHAESALREAEQKYREIFEKAGEGIFQSTPDGRYIEANPALACMYGFESPEELIQTCQDISREVYADPTRRQEFKRQIEKHGAVRGFELEVFRKDASRIWVSVNARAVRDREGRLLYYEGTAQEITARKLAEQALRDGEERYRELFDNATDTIYVHDLSGRYTSVNRAAEKLTGYTRDEIIGKSFVDFVSPEHLDNVRQQLSRTLTAEGKTSYETEVITKDGRRVAVEVNSHLIFENGGAVAVQGTARDITERKAAEEKLKATTEQLRALSARLQSAREEEGTRIAREIHDELGSVLTGLKWDLEEMDKMLSASIDVSELARLREKMQAPIKLADSAISAIRRIASELRPSVLDDLGLVAAIEWEAQQFQGRTGIACHCDCSLENVELSEKQSTAVFRIFQEALTNILRHAQATSVHIKIEKENGCFVLSVSDNGKGINGREKSEEQSLGILGMRERAQLIGGAVEIKGHAGKGTVVIVRVPTSAKGS